MPHRLWWSFSPLEKKAWERQIAPLPVTHLFPTRWQCLTGGAGGALKHGDPNALVVFIAVRHSPIRTNSQRSNTTEETARWTTPQIHKHTDVCYWTVLIYQSSMQFIWKPTLLNQEPTVLFITVKVRSAWRNPVIPTRMHTNWECHMSKVDHANSTCWSTESVCVSHPSYISILLTMDKYRCFAK